MSKQGDVKARSKFKARKKKTWRDTPDDIICSAQARPGKDGRLHWAPLQRAESLCPSDSTLERAIIENDQRALDILLAWQFSAPIHTYQTL